MTAGAAAASGLRTPALVPAAARLGAVALAVAVAYRYSLATLAAEWNHDTPLADLVLVPAVGAALFAAAAARHTYVGRLRLGRLDLLLGGGALALALGVAAAGPVLWSKYFWAMRLDLLTLPLLAAGAVVLLFGARALFPFAFPLAYLLLAWPLPYLALLERGLSTFTDATAAAVGTAAPAAHLARAAGGSDGTTFVVRHGGHDFVVSVGSACSGVNSLVGFLILAVAGLYFVRGRIRARLAWVACGAGLVWAFNLLRILAILGVGRVLGERAAFDVLHPVAGLVALDLAVIVLLRLRRRFGLTRRLFFDAAEVDSPIARPAPAADGATAKRVAVRLALLGAAAAALGLANGQLASAARGLQNDGAPAIAPFTADPAVGTRWRASRLETIGWATPYYGRHSSWVRYRLRPTARQATRGPFTVWLDAIVSPDLGALDSYSLAHCYAFHGFKVRLARRVDLGNGVVGQVFVYATSRATWHAVAWEWPVLRPGGRVEHERIVLLASSRTRPAARAVRPSSAFASPVLALANAAAPDADGNDALTRTLHEVAAAVVAARIGP